MTGESKHGGWLVSERTRAALGLFDGVLRSMVRPQDVHLRVMASHLLYRSGKRLRPALVLLSGELGTFQTRRLLRAAAAVELLHIASLYHDDVMDRAAARRGDVSANVSWGNGPAVLAGTYLFARAADVLGELGAVPTELASAAIERLCTGQLAELESAFDLEIAEAEHLHTLEQKTASLFELPCRLGAHLGTCPDETTQALGDYGRHLGLAFQLTDDALDFAGSGDELGKEPGTDLPQGVYSLAVLRALQRSDELGAQLRTLLERLRPTRADTLEAVDLVRSSGAVEEALDLARHHGREALRALDPVPESPASRSLAALAAYATARRA